MAKRNAPLSGLHRSRPRSLRWRRRKALASSEAASFPLVLCVIWRWHAVLTIAGWSLSTIRFLQARSRISIVPSLLRGEQRRQAETIARQSVLFEELALASPPPFSAGPKRVLLHGHCHQKSMGLLAPAQALLARIPKAQVVELDAGCCGMAGSFGYAEEHFEVSKKIAGRKLLPAAQGMQAGDVLVAAGTSCRHQVEDLADVAAIHPAVLLERLL